MNSRSVASLCAVGLLAAGMPAAAEDGRWVGRIGVTQVSPKSDNHSVVEVDDGTTLTFNVSYFLSPNWAIELLAAMPFEHDIDLVGGGRVAETKHLPPTLSAQYHFNPDGKVRPYAGVGINATLFFEEDTTGDLEGLDLELDDSYGAAAQLGVDFDIGDNMFLNAEVRYMDIETSATLGTTDLGDVEIDPWTFGVNFGLRF